MPVSRQSKLSHIAALIAVSNMGLWTYIDEDRILDRSNHWIEDPENEILSVAGFLMESDQHEEIFADEARSWYDQIEKLTDEQIIDRFGHHSDWIRKVLDT